MPRLHRHCVANHYGVFPPLVISPPLPISSLMLVSSDDDLVVLGNSPCVQRRLKLRQGYAFDCDCSRCSSESELSTELDKALIGEAVDKSEAQYIKGMELLEGGESQSDLRKACEMLQEVLERSSRHHHKANLQLVQLRSALLQVIFITCDTSRHNRRISVFKYLGI